jgi:hypothetical protein
MSDTHWNIPGYYGVMVSAQANDKGVPHAWGGPFDVIDLRSGPDMERPAFPDLHFATAYDALYAIANYGLFGHAYRIEARNKRRWTIWL